MNHINIFKFEAEIKQHEGLNAAFVLFPYDVLETFGKKGRIKVKAKFDESVEYRGSLVNMGYECHILGITQDVRKELNKTFGDKVQVEIQEDNEIREVEVPDDVIEVLKDNPEEKAVYEKLSYTHKKEYIQWIESAKKIETREKRLVSLIEQLNNKIKKNNK